MSSLDSITWKKVFRLLMDLIEILDDGHAFD